MDAKWLEGRSGEFDSLSVDVYTRHEPADCHESVVPQNGVHDYCVEYWCRSGDGHTESYLFLPVVQIVEVHRPEMLNYKWPDSQD